ncbi:MAG: hypothetical protein JO041_16455, partial [Acidobacteria bacterium]|nr:hypothetical protein [Acidobacteriota bacterium]
RLIREFSEVYQFSFAGEETVDGSPAWVVTAVPRPDYQPHSMEARLLKCLQGRLWISKSDYQWVKIEADAIDDFSFGVFLFKLRKGMHVYLEQARINNEIWLPRLVRATLNLRLGWHTERLDLETTYSNYRKFKVDATVLPAPN